MAKGKTTTGSATKKASPQLDYVVRVDKSGRNVYYNDYLHQYYYVPESKMRQLAFFDRQRTIFAVSLAAIFGATTSLWIGIALFAGLYILSSGYFYLSFIPALKKAEEPKLSESEQVLERGRRQKRTSRRIGYAVVCFATAAILAYYGMNQTFSGLDFWSAVILGVGCLVFGVYQLIIYFKRR